MTTVVFNIQDMFGVASNRVLTITPVRALVATGSAITAGKATKLTPANGVATADLVPGDYRVSVAGIPGSFSIAVPDSAEDQNAVDLASAGLPTYAYTAPQPWTSSGGYLYLSDTLRIGTAGLQQRFPDLTWHELAPVIVGGVYQVGPEQTPAS